jgi:hypothetical protein
VALNSSSLCSSGPKISIISVAKSGGAAMGDCSRRNVAGARSRWACNYLETGTQTIAVGDCLQVAN